MPAQRSRETRLVLNETGEQRADATGQSTSTRIEDFVRYTSESPSQRRQEQPRSQEDLSRPPRRLGDSTAARYMAIAAEESWRQPGETREKASQRLSQELNHAEKARDEHPENEELQRQYLYKRKQLFTARATLFPKNEELQRKRLEAEKNWLEGEARRFPENITLQEQAQKTQQLLSAAEATRQKTMPKIIEGGNREHRQEVPLSSQAEESGQESPRPRFGESTSARLVEDFEAEFRGWFASDDQ